MENEPKIRDMRARLNAAFDGDDNDMDPSASENDLDDNDRDDGLGEDSADNVTTLPTEFGTALRMVEALVFAASEPIDEATLQDRLPSEIEIPQLLAELQKQYEGRGVELVKVGPRWQFRTSPDLAFLMEKERIEPKKLSRAAIETLAIIAYHQPVTRVEIEQIRGVSVSKGTIDVLLETGWVRLRGRRRTPGRPVCYGTSQEFLEHFGLEGIKDLPGLEELSASGLLNANVPPGFTVPSPDDGDDSELDPVAEGEEDDISDDGEFEFDGAEDDEEDNADAGLDEMSDDALFDNTDEADAEEIAPVETREAHTHDDAREEDDDTADGEDGDGVDGDGVDDDYDEMDEDERR